MNNELLKDHLLIGKVKGSGAPVWYPINQLTRHLLIIGRTGCGKTNLLFLIICQLISRYSIWMFDRKEDFRVLSKMYPGNVLIFDLMKDFICNALRNPPFVHLKKWLEIFVDLFCRTNSLLDGSSSLLLKVLDKLYVDYKVYDGGKDYPSFYELLVALKNLTLPPYGRSTGYRESLVNRLEAYLVSNPRLYDCSQGFDIEKLMKKTVIFEIHGMMEQQANFWLNLLLYWMFSYRMGKKERGNRLKNLVVCDEARTVLSPFDNPTIGFSPITQMVSMLREFGVGIVAADQSANLNNSIFANSQLKILFPLGSGEDLLKAKVALGLNHDQAQYIHRLDIGEAIVRYYKIEEPFILQTPKVPIV